MRTVIKINNLIFYGDYQNINSTTLQSFQFKKDDIVWGDNKYINQQKIQYYFQLPDYQLEQQKKIIKLLQLNKIIPKNILIPFLYLKFKYIETLKKFLTQNTLKNILTLNEAQNICNSFPIILNTKIKYDFFKSVSGRVSSNIGSIKKQDRYKIQHKNQIIQLDFSSFQPMLYQDYFLKRNKYQIQDLYQKQKGKTRQQRKLNWYKKVYSYKQKVCFTNPFGRFKDQMLVYHFQCLQTDCMSRLLIQLNKLLFGEDKILMFMYDGILFDSNIKRVQEYLNKIDWNDVFPNSSIVKYPYKLSLVKG